MKKLILPLCLLAVCIITSMVCMFAATRQPSVTPSNKLSTREISVASFHEINADFAKVEVTVGPATGKATLIAPDNIIDDVKVSVSNGKLKITLKKESNIKHRKALDITLRVSAPYIDEVEAAVSARVEFSGAMTVPGKASYEADTSASILFKNLTVQGACEMDADTSGSIRAASLTVAGTTDLDADTSGSISIDTLSTTTLKAHADTSASVKVNAGKAESGVFKADTSGSVDVAGVQVDSASASADTAGSIKCNVKNLTSRHDTGGSVKNITK